MPEDYKGKPFQDSVYKGGAQVIPGRVQCAYYDQGGEGVAYHDSDAINHGSGELQSTESDSTNGWRTPPPHCVWNSIAKTRAWTSPTSRISPI